MMMEILKLYIEPGGSAWTSNEVNGRFYLFQLNFAGSVITNDGNTAEDIQDKIDKTNENKLELTLKKQNGQLKTVKVN